MTAAALDELATAAVAHLNRLFEATETRAWPQFRELPADLGPGFERLQRELGASRPAPAVVPRRSLLTPYFRRAGIDGMFDPFSLQVLVNDTVLPFERPFVTAHEWAHLAGFAHEAEANFVAWLTLPRGRRAHAVQRVAVSGGAASGRGPGIVAGGPRRRARSRPPRRLRGGSRADQPGDAHRPAGRPGAQRRLSAGQPGGRRRRQLRRGPATGGGAPISGAGGGRRPRSGGGWGRSDAGSPVRARQRGRLVPGRSGALPVSPPRRPAPKVSGAGWSWSKWRAPRVATLTPRPEGSAGPAWSWSKWRGYGGGSVPLPNPARPGVVPGTPALPAASDRSYCPSESGRPGVRPGRPPRTRRSRSDHAAVRRPAPASSRPSLRTLGQAGAGSSRGDAGFPGRAAVPAARSSRQVYDLPAMFKLIPTVRGGLPPTRRSCSPATPASRRPATQPRGGPRRHQGVDPRERPGDPGHDRRRLRRRFEVRRVDRAVLTPRRGGAAPALIRAAPDRRRCA